MVPCSLFNLSPFPQIKHLAIGVFDGFHLGHQAIIRSLLKNSTFPDSVAVLTFEPHPLFIIAPEKAPSRLTSSEGRIHLLQESGVKHIFTFSFDEKVRDSTPHDFIEQLYRIFPALESVTVGKGWFFGKGRAGNANVLREMTKDRSLTVTEIEPVHYQGKMVSSTLIRTAIAERKFDFVEALLGRPYSFTGIVVAGDGRGKQLSVPTANLGEVFEMLPPPGVYRCYTRINPASSSKPILSVVNIGCRPTFTASKRLHVEVHLLRFSGNLYGKQLELSQFQFLREEKKFDNIEALKSQIKNDLAMAEESEKILTNSK